MSGSYETDYSDTMNSVLGSIHSRPDMSAGQSLSLFNAVNELDGLLIAGAPDEEIDAAVSRFDQLFGQVPIPGQQQMF